MDEHKTDRDQTIAIGSEARLISRLSAAILKFSQENQTLDQAVLISVLGTMFMDLMYTLISEDNGPDQATFIKVMNEFARIVAAGKHLIPEQKRGDVHGTA